VSSVVMGRYSGSRMWFRAFLMAITRFVVLKAALRLSGRACPISWEA